MSAQGRDASRGVLVVAWLAGWAVALALVSKRLVVPVGGVTDGPYDQVIPVWDSTPWIVLLALAPLCWWLRGPVFSRTPRWLAAMAAAFVRANEGAGDPAASEEVAARERPGRRASWITTALLAAIIAGISIAASAHVAGLPVGPEGTPVFGELPPAYHDEYSYVFQARTFLAGRFAFPSHPAAPELFDQVHVLNEGTFASRYFPGTGAWIAPFLAVGHPYWGHWLAGAIAAVAVFFAGTELGGRGTGFVAGMLTAASPGVALFSNLLLAHQPTLMGLTVFLAAFLRLMRRPRAVTALVAGTGLSFAMLCRPMTAAGFALPFGVWMLGWIAGWWKSRAASVPGAAEPERPGESPIVSGPRPARRLALASALALPLLAGFVVIFVQNRAITENGFVTPYALYTDIYTPRHVYGFNNVVRGEQRLGPKVLDNYDRWAVNLTPAVAAENVVRRTIASLQWTLGIVPLVMAAVIVLASAARDERRWWLVALSIVSLHAAHVPYWFDGIMHWHYVFETAPLWILLFAGATATLARTAWRESRPALLLWWLAGGAAALGTAWWTIDAFHLVVAGAFVTCGLVLAAGAGQLATPRRFVGISAAATLVLLAVFFAASGPFWPATRLDAAVAEVGFSRGEYARFRRLLEENVTRRPALVVVAHDPADRHIDYVANDPALDGPILIARQRPGIDVERLRELFPERWLYLFDARSESLRPLPAR